MYKPLLVNVSVSLIVSGVQPHMTQRPFLTFICKVSCNEIIDSLYVSFCLETTMIVW